MASFEEEDKRNAREPLSSSSRRRKSLLPPSLHEAYCLPLGTFADGQSIYRNQLRKQQQSPPPESSSFAATLVDQQPTSLKPSAPQQMHFISSARRDDDDEDDESFENGHVHMSQLVLPETTTALLTSFGSPEFSWLESWLGTVSSVLLVHPGNGTYLPPAGGGRQLLVEAAAERLAEIGSAVLASWPLPPPPVESSSSCDTMSKENQTKSSSVDCSSSSNLPQPFATTTPNKKRRLDWHQMLIQPHVGLMHPKLCLFRNERGLRVVICGANLYQNQWECQRDVLWIQDFFNTNTTSNTTITTTSTIPTPTCTSNENRNDRSHSSNRLFGDTLYKFCRDLTVCATRDDQNVVDRFLYTILGFNNAIDFTTAAGTLVYSFPRRQQQQNEGHGNSRSNNDSCTHRGGWKMLAQSVQEQFKLQRQRDKGIMPNTIAQVVMGLKERHGGTNGKRKRRRESSFTNTTHIKTIHVMSGSLGDVKPDFLEQMKNALRGLPEPGSGTNATSWDAIVAAGRNSPSNSNNSRAVGWQIYWPSQVTAAKSMTMESIRGNMRAIPKAYWQTIPLLARQALFADVVHNPLKSSGMTGGYCYPNSHAKIILSLAPTPNVNRRREHGRGCDNDDDDDEYDEDVSDDEMDESSLYNILYVGSHNFSISAWGLRDTPPKNVELGIVLTTSLREQRREWIQRLPYKLSSSSAATASTTTTTGGCFSSDANYVPASGWEENMDETTA